MADLGQETKDKFNNEQNECFVYTSMIQNVLPIWDKPVDPKTMATCDASLSFQTYEETMEEWTAKEGEIAEKYKRIDAHIQICPICQANQKKWLELADKEMDGTP